MMAVAGEPILYITGRSREIVAAGPSPGRTPTAVPKSAPKKATSKLVPDRAMEKPSINPWKIFTVLSSLYRANTPGGSGTPNMRSKRKYMTVVPTMDITNVLNHFSRSIIASQAKRNIKVDKR